jgi:hypothetical protein
VRRENLFNTFQNRQKYAGLERFGTDRNIERELCLSFGFARNVGRAARRRSMHIPSKSARREIH